MDGFPTTKRQKEVLSLIVQLTKAKGGTGPTARELGDALGITYQAALALGDRLACRGLVRRTPPSDVTLKVIEEGAPSA